MKLSVIIHTKNEESNIRGCIKSVKKIADEILVIDMGSEDNTVQVAKNLGAKVYRHKDVNYADPARNYGISKAKGMWILSIDADERVSKSLAIKIINIIKKNKYEVIKIPHKNIILGKWMKHTGWWPDYHPRLFKKGYVTYFDTVHTLQKVEGRIYKLPAKEANAIVHHGHSTISSILERYDKYAELENYYKSKKKIKPSEIFTRAELEFESRYVDNEGFKDGLHGFILSKFREFIDILSLRSIGKVEVIPKLFPPKISRIVFLGKRQT